jgi:hypothetical protein
VTEHIIRSDSDGKSMDMILPAPGHDAYTAAALQRWKDRARRDPEYRGLQLELLDIADLRATLRSARDTRGILGGVILAGDSAIIGCMAND